MPIDKDDRDAARLVISALFVAAHIVAGDADATTIAAAVADADKLVDRVTKCQIDQPGAR